MLDLTLLVPRAAALLGPAGPWPPWRGDTPVAALLALVGLHHGWGTARAWRRGRPARRVLAGRAALFAGGLATLLLALLSPLDALSTALLSAHMVQYLLLTVVAPLLLLLGHVPAAGAARPARWTGGARAAGAALTRPAVVGALDIAVLLLWHLPGPYQATLRSDPLRLAAQGGALAAALLYWWAIRHPATPGGAGHRRTLASFLLTSLAGSAFGLLLFSTAGTPWYAIYGDRTAAWGLSPLADQQLAGLILGVLPEAFDLLPFVLVTAAWLRSEERRGRTPRPPAPVARPGPVRPGLSPNSALLLVLVAFICVIMLATLLLLLAANHRG